MTCSICHGACVVKSETTTYPCPGCRQPKQWGQRDFMEHQQNLFARAASLAQRKNDDYAGEGEAFRNFASVAALGIASVEQGFLVRMTDKLSRLSTFASRGELSVRDESVDDTIIDLINYACLLSGYIKSRRPE